MNVTEGYRGKRVPFCSQAIDVFYRFTLPLKGYSSNRSSRSQTTKFSARTAQYGLSESRRRAYFCLLFSDPAFLLAGGVTLTPLLGVNEAVQTDRDFHLDFLTSSFSLSSPHPDSISSFVAPK